MLNLWRLRNRKLFVTSERSSGLQVAGVMASVRAWMVAYLPGAWSGHTCQGLAMGILGPTMPYLAAQVLANTLLTPHLPRWGCLTSRSGSYGRAGRWVTAPPPSSPAQSSGPGRHDQARA